MKKIQVLWKEMSYYEFPNDAPIDDLNVLGEYVDNHPEAKGDWDYFCVGTENYDGEIS